MVFRHIRMRLVSPEQGGERDIFTLFNPVITFHISVYVPCYCSGREEGGGGYFHEHSPAVRGPTEVSRLWSGEQKDACSPSLCQFRRFLQ